MSLTTKIYLVTWAISVMLLGIFHLFIPNFESVDLAKHPLLLISTCITMFITMSGISGWLIILGDILDTK